MISGGLGSKVDPWAFIRVKDERTTLLASLNSILPVIKKGVIGYNECTDGSDKIIEQFCRDNPGFIPFHYPYHVESQCSKEYATGSLAYENTLAAYYNAVLQVIPKNEWLIKIDVDQIYFPDILEHSFYLPKRNSDLVIYSRLNTVRTDNNEIKVIDCIRPGDHWLVYNNNLEFINKWGEKENGDFFSWEELKMGPHEIPYFPECSSIHFPFEKKYRPYAGDVDALPSIDSFMETADETEFSEELLAVKDIVKTFENV